MTIPEADICLPESRELQNVFDVAIKTHFTIGKTMQEIERVPIEKVAVATRDFLKSSLAYFANRGHSEYAQIAGTNAWRLLQSYKAFPLYAEDVYIALIYGFHMSPDMASQIFVPDDPMFIIDEMEDKGVAVDVGYILFPPAFAVRVMTKPIEALATTAILSSQLNDMANFRNHIDNQNIALRAGAFASDFLHFAQENVTDFEVGDSYQRLMYLHPLGMKSLPESAKYIPVEINSPENKIPLN
jgi:hypothetical protein